MSNHPESRSRSRQNLADLFCEFSQSPDEFIEYDNGYRSWKYTYIEVAHAARHFAMRLDKHKVRKGDKVIFWSENRPEWVAAFWGCILSGVIIVPIDYRTSLRFLRHVQEIVDARLILIGEEVQLSPSDRQLPAWRLSELE